MVWDGSEAWWLSSGQWGGHFRVHGSAWKAGRPDTEPALYLTSNSCGLILSLFSGCSFSGGIFCGSLAPFLVGHSSSTVWSGGRLQWHLQKGGSFHSGGFAAAAVMEVC